LTTDYRLTSVDPLAGTGSTSQTFDDNGNLLDDGVYTYTYDGANRLTVVSNQSSVVSYRYNGLGDRLQQTVNGQTTTFTMDLASDLTQVLDDGTNAYLYGNGRIAQVNAANTEYFLGDALGSVRQMTDANSVVSLAQNYNPYGVITQTSGTASTSYGFTGEQQSDGMVYLRSRFYGPSISRFLTRDTWDGDENMPMSYNKWAYVYGNPVNKTDPSGNEPIFNGYAEGWSTMASLLVFILDIRGEEIVYDFATLERASFSYHGVGYLDGSEETKGKGLCANLSAGWSLSTYVTGISGFINSPDHNIQKDYAGDSSSLYLTGDLPIFGVAGFTNSGVLSSTAWVNTWVPNLAVQSISYNVGVNAGDFLDAVPAEVGIYHSVYVMTSRVKKYNDKEAMIEDINSGDNSPFVGGLAPWHVLRAVRQLVLFLSQ